jgi:hypothetical protein
MNAAWKQLLAKVAPYLVAVVVAGGGYAAWAHAEREIGRRDLLLAQARADVASASRKADSLAKVYRVDTVRLARLVQRWDTLYASLTDTLTVARTDTVRVPVQVLVTADSTIRACRAVVLTCEQRVAAADDRSRAALRQADALRRAQPTAVHRWSERALLVVIGAAISVRLLK